MTLLADLQSFTLTASAKNAGHKAGVNLQALIDLSKQKSRELTALLTIIETLHPTTGSAGADASNYAQLGTIVAELA
jgi:hypothetical protein